MFRALALRRSDVSFRISLLWPITLSTQLIKPNYLVIFPPTKHHSFFRNLPPLLFWNRLVLTQTCFDTDSFWQRLDLAQTYLTDLCWHRLALTQTSCWHRLVLTQTSFNTDFVLAQIQKAPRQKAIRKLEWHRHLTFPAGFPTEFITSSSLQNTSSCRRKNMPSREPRKQVEL